MVTVRNKHGSGDDLDQQARAERLRAVIVTGVVLMAGLMLFLGGRATSQAEERAAAQAGAKFTLAQQVASACAAKTGADDLGGICQSATQIVKAGPAGTAGIQGIQGVQGVDGLTGLAGLQGPLGPKGEQGVTGLTGSQGIAGLLGKAGVAGADSTLQGPQGLQGPAGADGQAGPIGATGAAGVPGKTPTQMTCTKVIPPTPSTGPPDSNPWTCVATAWTP